jgi:hypothetical protein
MKVFPAMGRMLTRFGAVRCAPENTMHDTPHNREMQPPPRCRGSRLPHSCIFSILQDMISLVSQYALRPFAGALAALLISTLLWCGDAECRSGTSPDQCASLLCALFAQHDDASSPVHGSACSHDCTCACHTPVLPPLALAMLQEVRAEVATFDYIAAIPVSPLPMVYHPPRG